MNRWVSQVFRATPVGPPPAASGGAWVGTWRYREIALVAAAFAILTVWWLAPAFRHPGSGLLYPPDPWRQRDVNLVIWIMAWVSRALFRDPTHLFDANIFHPAPEGLAGTEHMLGYVPFFAPLYALTGNPLLGLHATILASFTLTGVGMYALLRHWGVNAAGAFFGGYIFAFFPSRLDAMHELQLLSLGFLPLALMFLERSLLGHQRVRSAAAFAGLLLWQMLCSVYLAFVALAGLGGHLIGFLAAARRRVQLRALLPLGAALAVAAVVFVIVHRPYVEQRREGVIPEYGTQAWMVVASNDLLSNYITPPWSIRRGEGLIPRGRPLYIGILPALSIAALVLLRRRREESPAAVTGALAITAAGYLLGLGPQAVIRGVEFVLPYAWLAEWVPGFSSLRVPSRFGFLFMMGVGALAGIGFGRLLSRGSTALRMLCVAGAVIATSYDFDLPRLEPRVERRIGAPAALPVVYEALVALPRGPVLEVPVRRQWLVRGRDTSLSMYYSIFHWQPLILGYSGYAPPSSLLIDALAQRLPEARSLELLCRLTGLRYVVVNHARMDEETAQQWRRVRGLRSIDRGKFRSLFRTTSDCVADLEQRLLQPLPWTETVLGTPLQELPELDTSVPVAGLRFLEPPPTTAFAPWEIVVHVEIVNQTSRTWPALAPRDHPVVSVGYRWEHEEGSDAAGPCLDVQQPTQLPFDLAPGDSVDLSVGVVPPSDAGAHWLEIRLMQSGRWLGAPLARMLIEVLEPRTPRARRAGVVMSAEDESEAAQPEADQTEAMDSETSVPDEE